MSNKNKPTTIHEQTLERFRTALENVDALLDDAERFLDAKHAEALNEEGNLRGQALFMLARGAIALRSVKRLFINGHETDAMSVSRTIAELLIDLKYIRTDPERLTLLYARYVHVANWRRYQQLQKFPLFAGKATGLEVQRLKAKYEHFKNDYPDPRQWAGLSIADRAAKSRKLEAPTATEPVGAEMVYELMHRSGSEALHSGPGTLQDLVDDYDGGLTGLPRAAGSTFVLFLAAFSYLYLFMEARECFGETIVDGHKEIADRLTGFLVKSTEVPA